MREIEYSKNIKRRAEILLKNTNLIKVLSEFGKVEIGGSFKYDLMWGPDIDMVVICDNPREASKDVLEKIIDLRLFQKYEYGDFVKFKREDRPESYIVNMRQTFEGQKWEIEAWFFKKYPKSQEEMDKLIKEKLNQENKEIVLEIKRKREEEGVDKHKINSAEIYRQVLIEGVKDYEELVSKSA